MDVSGMFSDDQMAVIGCFVALAVCGLIATISFHFGPAGRQQNQADAQCNRRLSLESSVDQNSRQNRRAA